MLKRAVPSAVLCALLLSSCGGSGDAVASKTATQGVAFVQNLREEQGPSRPSASLGMFAALFLGEGGYFPVKSALASVNYLMHYTEPLNPDNLSDAFLLLQEFGGVLQVDIPDLLNRSTDRANALNTYLESIGNITVRAQRKAKELQAAMDARNADLKTDQAQLNDVLRQIREASSKQDYATVGSLQQERSTTQAKVDKEHSDIDRLRDVLSIYTDLLDLANRRVGAMTENRELLIAGLKAVDVPGVRELEVILKKNNRGGYTPQGQDGGGGFFGF